MTRQILFLFLFILCGCASKAQSQTQPKQQPDSLGLPGDNLNLYAVMNLFQNSATLEGFEKSLNDQNSKINNLDLNNDDKTDYIKVIDNVDKDVHRIVLQVPINDKENQDVAVFIVEKNSKGGVDIQLIGDEELYGKDYIIEPNYSDQTKTDQSKTKETPNPGYVKQSSSTTTDANGNTTIINNYTTTQTAAWPVVTFMYMPTYTIWVSPWRWGYYPPYWNPWTPIFWHQYYGYQHNVNIYFYGNYRYCNYYRNPVVYHSYYSSRSVSVSCRVNINTGVYRRTYSRPETRMTGHNDFMRDSKMPDRNFPANNGNKIGERNFQNERNLNPRMQGGMRGRF